MLARAARLEEAEQFISSMEVAPNIKTWTALLGACRTHKDVPRAERAAEQALKINHSEAPIYVLLANVYLMMQRDLSSKFFALFFSNF